MREHVLKQAKAFGEIRPGREEEENCASGFSPGDPPRGTSSPSSLVRDNLVCWAQNRKLPEVAPKKTSVTSQLLRLFVIASLPALVMVIGPVTTPRWVVF